MARDYLVNKLAYPEDIQHNEYDESFAIRGLHYDLSKGYLFKVDHLYNLQVGSAFYGRERLSLPDLQQAYGRSLHIGLGVRPRLRMLNDLFSLSEACLLADVVDKLASKGVDFEPRAVSDDVLRALEYVHASGYMHEEVRLNFSKYCKSDPALRQVLERLRHANKSLFLLTNSPPAFIDAGMRYLIGEDWRKLFHVTMCSADKPRWYSSSRPFRKVSDNFSIDFSRVTNFQDNGVYVHGSLDELHRITGWEGRKVLYWGDQLYTDLVQPGKWRGWRTGAIIRELEVEIDKQSTDVYRISLSHVLQLERKLSELYSVSPNKSSPEIRKLQNVRNILRHELKVMFNQNFGSVFRTHTNPTPLAYHLQRDADIYTSRLENLSKYSLNHCFYTERRYLPHETMIVPLSEGGHPASPI
eukprot:TRINITY_DN3224_c0_g1_i1.p1 TRINITY_DN3224_c0_g1~~TRINITY_DN3224_c0_g1_i1.p1  ORF type:complete len:413 (-),score=68.06 TRINITY_DN3224_c0_g1_i1:28-1266(-)